MSFGVVLILVVGSHANTAYAAKTCEQCVTSTRAHARSWNSREQAQRWLNTHPSMTGIVTSWNEHR